MPVIQPREEVLESAWREHSSLTLDCLRLRAQLMQAIWVRNFPSVFFFRSGMERGGLQIF